MTAEILTFKALNRDIDKNWVEWEVDILMAGFDTEHLTILTVESEPFNRLLYTLHCQRQLILFRKPKVLGRSDKGKY